MWNEMKSMRQAKRLDICVQFQKLPSKSVTIFDQKVKSYGPVKTRRMRNHSFQVSPTLGLLMVAEGKRSYLPIVGYHLMCNKLCETK